MDALRSAAPEFGSIRLAAAAEQAAGHVAEVV
jgi:hypothetical protein